MRKILERYIAKTVIFSTGLCALIIFAVLFLLTLLAEFKNIGEGDYGLIQAFFYVLLRLPNEIYQFSPMLILLGSITGLSILAAHYELAVMRASGFSMNKIILSVLWIAFFLTLLVSVLGEGIGPVLSSKAEIRKENAQNAGQAVVTAAGIWFHIGNNFIHVEHVIGRHLLEGVTRYQFDQAHRLEAAYFAKKLIFHNNGWKMEGAVKTTFYPEQTKSTKLLDGPWDIKFNHNLFNVGIVDPHEMPLPRLISFARYLEHNGLQSSEYWYDFWQRLLQPFAAFVMVFLAIPFVLSTMNRLPLGWRIIAGIMVGFIFFIMNALLGQLCIVYQVPTLLAAAIPPLLFGLIGIFLSKKLISH